MFGVLLDLNSEPCILHIFDRMDESKGKSSLIASIPVIRRKYRCHVSVTCTD